jgi:hypothetical protein
MTTTNNTSDYLPYRPDPIGPIMWKESSTCLHDNCSSCNGTGIRKDGLGPCVHMISCSCPKCRITC